LPDEDRLLVPEPPRSSSELLLRELRLGSLRSSDFRSDDLPCEPDSRDWDFSRWDLDCGDFDDDSLPFPLRPELRDRSLSPSSLLERADFWEPPDSPLLRKAAATIPSAARALRASEDDPPSRSPLPSELREADDPPPDLLLDDSPPLRSSPDRFELPRSPPELRSLSSRRSSPWP
jgi:hypothetical protein